MNKKNQLAPQHFVYIMHLFVLINFIAFFSIDCTHYFSFMFRELYWLGLIYLNQINFYVICFSCLLLLCGGVSGVCRCQPNVISHLYVCTVVYCVGMRNFVAETQANDFILKKGAFITFSVFNLIAVDGVCLCMYVCYSCCLSISWVESKHNEMKGERIKNE